jgi:hypothetical protein
MAATDLGVKTMCRTPQCPNTLGATLRLDGAGKSHNYSDVSGHPCPETVLNKGLRTYRFAVVKGL